MTEKEDIVFSVSVDKGGEGAKSLRSLKQDYKELQIELENTIAGTEEYNKVLVKLGAVKDDIGDLNATIQALNPEGKVAAFQNVAGKLAGGFQAATGAAALFGVQSEDLEKQLLKVQAATAFAQGIQSVAGLGDAFKVLGTVLKTNPILLIASIIAGIGVALYSLKDRIKVVGDVFNYFGGIISDTVQAVKDFTDSIGLSTFALDEQAAAAKKAADEIYNVQKESAENYIKLQEAQGISTRKAREDQYNSNIEFLEKELDYLRNEYFVKKNISESEFQEKFRKLSKEKVDIYVNYKASVLKEEKVLQDQLIKNQEKLREEYKRTEKERTRAAVQSAKDNLAITRAGEAAAEANNKAVEDRDRAAEEKELKDAIKLIEDRKLQRQRDTEDADQYWAEETTKEDERLNAELERKKKHEEEMAQAKVQAVDTSLQASKALSDLYFDFQLKKAKGNAQQELEIRKKQFQVDKAFSITRAVIDGVRSVQAALTLPPPASYVLAAANGVLAAANIIKIASTKFEPGNVSADTSGLNQSAPSINTSAPNIQPETKIQNQDSDKTQSISVKAELVETQATDTQKRVKRLGEQASF